jgi:hypothetical protein
MIVLLYIRPQESFIHLCFLKIKYLTTASVYKKALVADNKTFIAFSFKSIATLLWPSFSFKSCVVFNLIKNHITLKWLEISNENNNKKFRDVAFFFHHLHRHRFQVETCSFAFQKNCLCI